MIGHEILGVFVLAFTGVILVSLFSKNSNTAGIIQQTGNSFATMANAISGAGGQQAA